MPDDRELETFVQELIAKDESQDVIDSVIDQWDSTHPAGPSARPNVYAQPVLQSAIEGAIGFGKQAYDTVAGLGATIKPTPIGLPAVDLRPILEGATQARYEAWNKGDDPTKPWYERGAYKAAGLLPFIGPAAVSIGENLGSGEPERMGRATFDIAAGTVGSSPKARVGIVDAATATGRGAKAAVKSPMGAFLTDIPTFGAVSRAIERSDRQAAAAEAATRRAAADARRVSNEQRAATRRAASDEQAAMRARGVGQAPMVPGSGQDVAATRATAAEAAAAADMRARGVGQAPSVPGGVRRPGIVDPDAEARRIAAAQEADMRARKVGQAPVVPGGSRPGIVQPATSPSGVDVAQSGASARYRLDIAEAYRALKSKTGKTQAEFAQMDRFKALLDDWASGIGMSHAAAGKTGIP